MPLVYSSASWASNDYGLMFLWDQPVEKVLRAAATLQMRANAGATLCVVYVAKAVRDKIGHMDYTMDRRKVEQYNIAYFLNCALKENIDV